MTVFLPHDQKKKKETLLINENITQLFSIVDVSRRFTVPNTSVYDKMTKQSLNKVVNREKLYGNGSQL